MYIYAIVPPAWGTEYNNNNNNMSKTTPIQSKWKFVVLLRTIEQ